MPLDPSIRAQFSQVPGNNILYRPWLDADSARHELAAPAVVGKSQIMVIGSGECFFRTSSGEIHDVNLAEINTANAVDRGDAAQTITTLLKNIKKFRDNSTDGGLTEKEARAAMTVLEPGDVREIRPTQEGDEVVSINGRVAMSFDRTTPVRYPRGTNQVNFVVLSPRPGGNYYDLVITNAKDRSSKGMQSRSVNYTKRIPTDEAEKKKLRHSGDMLGDSNNLLAHRVSINKLEEGDVYVVIANAYHEGKPLTVFAGQGCDPAIMIPTVDPATGEIHTFVAIPELSAAAVGRSRAVPFVLIKKQGGKLYIQSVQPGALDKEVTENNTGQFTEELLKSIRHHVGKFPAAIAAYIAAQTRRPAQAAAAAPAPKQAAAAAIPAAEASAAAAAAVTLKVACFYYGTAAPRLLDFGATAYQCAVSGTGRAVYPGFSAAAHGNQSLAMAPYSPAAIAALRSVREGHTIPVHYHRQGDGDGQWLASTHRCLDELENGIVFYEVQRNVARSVEQQLARLETQIFMNVGPTGMCVVVMDGQFYLYHPVPHEIYKDLLDEASCYTRFANITRQITDNFVDWCQSMRLESPFFRAARYTPLSAKCIYFNDAIRTLAQFKVWFQDADLIKMATANTVKSALVQFARILTAQEYDGLCHIIAKRVVEHEQAFKSEQAKHFREIVGGADIKKKLNEYAQAVKPVCQVKKAIDRALQRSQVTFGMYTTQQVEQVSAAAMVRKAAIAGNVEQATAKAPSEVFAEMCGDGKCQVVMYSPEVLAQFLRERTAKVGGTAAFCASNFEGDTSQFGACSLEAIDPLFGMVEHSSWGGNGNSPFLAISEDGGVGYVAVEIPEFANTDDIAQLKFNTLSIHKEGSLGAMNQSRIQHRAVIAAVMKKLGIEVQARDIIVGRVYLKFLLETAMAIDAGQSLDPAERRCLVRSVLGQYYTSCASGSGRPLRSFFELAVVGAGAKTIQGYEIPEVLRLAKLMHTAGWLANGLFQKNLREAVLRAISSTRFKAAASAASASASGAGPGFIKLLDMLNAAKSRHHKNFNDQGLRSGGDKAFFEKLQEIRRGLRKEVRKAGIDLYDLTGVPCKLVCTNEKSPNKFTSWDLEQVATPQAAAEVSGAAAEPQQRDVFMQLLIGFGLDPDSTQQTNVEHLVRLAFGFAPDADLTPFLRALFVALKDVAKDSFISSQNKPAVVAAGLAEFGSTAAAAFEGMVGVDNEMAAAAAKKPAEPGPAAPAQAVIDNEAEEGCDDGDFDAAAAARKPAESGPAAPSGAALFTLPAEGVAYEAGKALTAFLNSYTSATKGE